MKNVHEPTYSFVILTLILIVINTLLAYLSVKFIPTAPSGFSYFFFAAAFMILFTLWYGGYGAVAAYIGTLIGSGYLVHQTLADNPGIALLWAVAGLLQVVIPLVAVRSFGVNLALEERRDLTIIILFGVVINNIVGAAWGAWTYSLVVPDMMGSIFSTWLISNFLACILIIPIALRLITPKLQRSRLFVRFYWN